MYPNYQSKFPELDFYGLPGHTRTPRDVLRQAHDGEVLGLGNLMISERSGYKEISAICGACAAVTESFMGPAALKEAIKQIRLGEQASDRELGSVKLWSVLATLCNPTEEECLKRIVARLATYLQIPSYGEALVSVNGWEQETLTELRSHVAVNSIAGLIDSVASVKQMAAIDKILPESWRPAAVGDAKTCAKRWLEEFEAGADGIIIHASTPEEFAPVLREYEKMRPAKRFEGR